MRNSRTGSFAFTLAVVFVLAACRSITAAPASGERRSPENSLAGSAWVLTTLEGQDPISDTTITLRFAADGTVGGSNGCNNYQGAYTIAGTTLRFPSDFAATMMACPEPTMTQGDTLMRALERTVTFKVDSMHLRLLDVSGTELAVFAPQDENVAGKSWKVTAYNNGKQAVVSVIIGTQVTASFGEDGRVTGSAGCNNYFASYELDKETIKIGPAGATRRFCAEPEGAMEQESRYLEALQSAATFRIAGKKLELRTVEGALAVTLVP